MANTPSKKNLLGEQVIKTREKDTNKLREDSNIENKKRKTLNL